MTTHTRSKSRRKVEHLEWVRGWCFVPCFSGCWDRKKGYLPLFPFKNLNRKEKKKTKMYMRNVPF